MSSSVSSVYLHVIEVVITKVRDEFINSVAGESVLGELQAFWKTKMMLCGVIPPNILRPLLQKQSGTITLVHDLNVSPVEEYQTPTIELFFPPTPLSPWMNQRPLGVDVNVASVEGHEECGSSSSNNPEMMIILLI